MKCTIYLRLKILTLTIVNRSNKPLVALKKRFNKHFGNFRTVALDFLNTSSLVRDWKLSEALSCNKDTTVRSLEHAFE